MIQDIQIFFWSWFITGALWGVIAWMIVRKGGKMSESGWTLAEKVVGWALMPVAYIVGYALIEMGSSEGR